VPPGTELDFFASVAYVSIVGFRFLKTTVFGLPDPFHPIRGVNLRSMSEEVGDGWRRGVVFIRELVPRRAIRFCRHASFTGSRTSRAMRHRIEHSPSRSK